MTIAPLLLLDQLHIELPNSRGRARNTVIHDVNLEIRKGQTVGLVGESGSGKSMTTKAVMRLLPRGARTTGCVQFEGQDVQRMSGKELSEYRSRKVSMIYQDPRAHTNPLVTVGDFLVESVVATKQLKRQEALDKACSMLEAVGVADAPRRMRQYPHELSGGLLQRMMIVMALLPAPSLILADEPTTALDVTVQSEVMAILADEIRQRELGMLFITHDLDLAAAASDALAVMYAGVIVEKGPVDEVYRQPKHPYTLGLLRSRPSLTETKRMVTIPGRPISAFEAGPGCVFASRCPFATAQCQAQRPVLRTLFGRSVACHHAENIDDDSMDKVAI